MNDATLDLAVCSECKMPEPHMQAWKGGWLCRGCKVILFFEQELSLVGDYSGRPFKLMPWNQRILRDVFGTLDGEGLRKYRDVYIEVPAGNSKTTLAAGLVVFSLIGSKTTGTEVYSAATAKEQAGIVFRAAAQMVNANPRLRARLRIVESTKRILKRDDPSSFYAALSADGDIHDGIAPSFVVRDELHRWRTRKAIELNDVLERKVMKRTEPLIWDITTAGEVDESPLCWRRHEYARLIQDGAISDPRFYGRVWAADLTKVAWNSIEARVMANPSHEANGGFVRDKDLADLCVKAENDPVERSKYLRYHLNVWGQAEERAIDMEQWLSGGGNVDMRTWPEYDVDLLIRKWGLLDKPCYAGIDASWTTDLTALAFVFPPESDGGAWREIVFFYMPEGQVKERERKDKVPYSDWIGRGFIDATPGNAIQVATLKDKLRWAAEMFELRTVAYDPWNFKEHAAQLVDEGFTMAEVRQGYATLSEPTKKLLELYQTGRLWHGNNPVLNWCAGCLCVQGDRKDNIQPAKPERARSSKRIDGISATVTALTVAASEEAATPRLWVI